MAASVGMTCICHICIRSQTMQHGSKLLGLAALRSPQLMMANSKHYLPQFKKLRAKKVFKVDLPDMEKARRESKMSPEEMRSKYKKDGIQPPRHFQERGINLASTNAVFEEYVPPEGDGVASLISGKRAKQAFTGLEKKGKSYMQVRKVRQFDEDFDPNSFADPAQDIYLEAHELLQDIEKNEDRLHELVSEKAYPEMTWKLEKKTMRWKLLESLEPPRVVHVRTTDFISKDNIYAQVTVRHHTKQTLAIYDRFGRLMLGSEKLAKDCLEYVVYEKHLSDEYGRWRLHSKLIPEWMPPRQQVLKTIRVPTFEPEEPEPEEGKEGTKDKEVTASAAS